MASQSRIINNYSWDQLVNIPEHNWIQKNSTQYQFLRSELIDKIFANLLGNDKELLLDSLVRIINFIHFRFGIKNDAGFWKQLIQNNLLDCKAFLNMTLPFINESEDSPDKKKKGLTKLSDLYIKKDERGQFLYTTSQYNRCVRHRTGDHTVIIERPFLREYFLNHLELLMMSIETVSNKLYINWIDILPVRINDYDNDLFKQTKSKIIGNITESKYDRDPITKINLINNYIDPLPGLTYQDVYNTIVNHLYHQIKNYRWLIFDIMVNGKLVCYINYFETRFHLKDLWDGKLWSQLPSPSRNGFANEWHNFLDSNQIEDNTVLNNIYFVFCKYYHNAERLVQLGLLICPTLDTEDLDEEDIVITSESTNTAKSALADVPVEEIYSFLCYQFSSFKESWYYYMIKIKKNAYVAEVKEYNMWITPKNIYNYAKNMAHYITPSGKFKPLPKYWTSLMPVYLEMIVYRMLDIPHKTYNDWTNTKGNWFNINKILRLHYPYIDNSTLYKVNYAIHHHIRLNLVDIIFESLIYHGLLSEFKPNGLITNDQLVESQINSNDEDRKKEFKYAQIKKIFKETDYGNNSYYYLTGTLYGQMEPLKSAAGEKTYLDAIASEQNWSFTYAMNWVSQINFYHHYLNNRVIYITGSTGVGKSTQVPKLLMYSQKMVNYNANGKIICTQPRIHPTVENANIISAQLGVPINGYNKLYDASTSTSNYYIQYQYANGRHVDPNAGAFFRVVTDGVLSEMMMNSAFMSREIIDTAATDSKGIPLEWIKKYQTGNKFDILVVDEAHEHNANMDIILTLARDAAYVNNSLKLVIISATMDDDEPIYRRYYRTINDNRAFPLNAYIEHFQLDRANMDRRIHISPPGKTTQFKIIDHYATKSESDSLSDKTYVDTGIEKTIQIVLSTNSGNILLFMAGESDIKKSVKEINEKTPPNIICFGYYAKLSEERQEFIKNIHNTLKTYNRYKDDVDLEEKEITRRVPTNTYTRAVIIATNVAEASITLKNLKYVVDTGFAKVNIFDPLEGISNLKTLPISNSSSVQRRGRVGRLESGEVYYLYDKEKVINNKTAYKIADDNIMSLLVKLLKSEPLDTSIITQLNDINYILNINQIIYIKNSPMQSDYESVYADVLEQYRAYEDIILKQYMYTDDIKDIKQYYTYYGKVNLQQSIPNTLDEYNHAYFVENHDDYQFQQRLAFQSRCYTGYDQDILEDQTLRFYLIHPDENIITRNLFTGDLSRLKMNIAIPSSYYYCVLDMNDIDVTSDISKLNIDYDHFVLPKCGLAFVDAKLQSLVIDISSEQIGSRTIKYTDSTSKSEKIIKSYYDAVIPNYYNFDSFLIKSTFVTELNSLQKIFPIDLFREMTNLLWYTYAMPYGVEDDVIALICFINHVPSISKWFKKIENPDKNESGVIKQIDMHTNKYGDIYFVWQLWNEIKKILNEYNLVKIDAITENKFRTLKTAYTSNIKIPIQEYSLLENMYRSGKLNTRDEFFYYITGMTVDMTDIIKNSGVNHFIDIVAKNHGLDSEQLQTMIVEFCNIQFSLKRNIWIREYQIKYQLIEKEDMGETIEQIKQKFLFPRVIIIPIGDTISRWDIILETYLRTFSINLLKNEVNYYLKINRGIRISQRSWGKSNFEDTLVDDRMNYFVYHNEESKKGEIFVSYLTPVKLEWILELNPLYYYYYFFDEHNILYRKKDDPDVIRTKQLLIENKKLFNVNNLISYIGRFTNKTIAETVRYQIYDYIKNF